MIAFADLLSPLTSAQIRASMVAQLKTLGVPADQWRAGGVFSTMLTVIAISIAMFSTLLAQGIGAGFLETASGGWLTLLAYYVYGVTRPAATFASGQLTLVNAGGGSFTYSAGQVTFLASTTKQQYVNAAGFTLAPLSTLTITVTAVTSGSVGSAAPGQIDTLVTSMLLVSCSNATGVVGLDALDDPGTRALCLDALGAMSVRGPRTAYSYAIRTAINPVTVAPVNVNRWTVASDSHTGIVLVYVAGPAGTTDPNDIAGIVTSLDAVARPDAVTALIQAAVPVAYSAGITVWCTAAPGLASADVLAAVQTAIVNYFKASPISGWPKLLRGQTVSQGIFASGLDGAIRDANPNIYAVDGTIDLAMFAGQVATNATSVTVNVIAAYAQTG